MTPATEAAVLGPEAALAPFDPEQEALAETATALTRRIAGQAVAVGGYSFYRAAF
ncbi:MAG TPA: hypothetical protein VD769_10470 [Gaiellaceae bacterium]|nr:hypothetical protein [Gaiellaceae bacterium]